MARHCKKCGQTGHYSSTCGRIAKICSDLTDVVPEVEVAPTECDADPYEGGPLCSKCGKVRDPSGVDGGKWIHRGADYGKCTTVKAIVSALDTVADDESEIVFVKPRKGLWIVSETRKKIAGKIHCVRADGTVVYENCLGAIVDSTPDTILTSGYTYAELQPKMLNWSHGA